MTGVSVTLGRDVPPLDRVEMEAVAAAAWDFPIEDVVIDIDGVRQPKTHVEVGDKNLSSSVGILTVVNRTRATWPEGAEMTASWPGEVIEPPPVEPPVEPSVPAWVPENAKIHIDLVGGTPQGRAWVDGTGEVAVDTLLGGDPNTEDAMGPTSYNSVYLTVDGYVKPVAEEEPYPEPVALIGVARTMFLNGVTARVQYKIISAEIAGAQTEIQSMSADGAASIMFFLEFDPEDFHVNSAGSFDERLEDIVNVGLGDLNAIAFTLVDARIEFTANGSTGLFAGVLDAADMPPGNPFAAVALDMTNGQIAIQSITIYDPLPSTAGLSELSELPL
jgi:hypothetical protein